MQSAIALFNSQSIPVLTPNDREKQRGYEQAIATSSLLFRFSRPDCVVQPENTSQVQTIIREARARGLKVTIKCNGHSYAGHSTAFEGISLDLRRMNRVSLDMGAKTVTVDAGCQWGHVYGTLVNGRHVGHIIVGGRCPTVGVGGFLLGGGLSPFTRSFGMGSDSMVEATVVTRDGEVVTVGEADAPTSRNGRLFWALRGAGGGNFGVVVEMKLRVQKLEIRYGTVVAGRYQWFPKDGFTDDPSKMTIDSTWICDLRQSTQGGVRFTVAFDGSKLEYDRRIDEFIKHPDLNRQLKRRVLAEPSTRFLYETLVGQSTFLVTWIHAGGRATDIMAPSDSAYYWRQAMELDMRTFLAKVKRALRPFSLNGEAAFINFPDRDFPRKSQKRAYFGGNCKELRRVKQMWDKDNFLKWVQCVKRPGDPEEDPDEEREENEEDRTDRLASEQWQY
ncbi:FAD-binding domain-containing protein [Parathielavia hyrcaniae]|uniref:FAD-binding domain-containing protein n=1 Tax=Parathielavia hyrcaniae TaxID=113614 RepID=A0AAN6PS83_9PEZI|nr:FAD-binding domain-containing protein [Parathielavia hyrcaniae]